MGAERDFALGGGHTVQCADNVSLSCTCETCMVLLTKYHLNKLNKKGTRDSEIYLWILIVVSYLQNTGYRKQGIFLKFFI